MKSEPIFQSLPCVLTSTEKALKADELAREVDRHAELEREKKSAAEGYAKDLKESDRKIAQLAEEVRTGVAQRPVECTERRVFGANLVELVRADTGEVVGSRAMTAQERQEAFAYAGDDTDDDDTESRAH